MAQTYLHNVLKTIAKKLTQGFDTHEFQYEKYQIVVTPLDRQDVGATDTFKVSVVDKRTKTNYVYVIKKAPTDNTRRENFLSKSSFEKEIYFYSKAYPILKTFEKQYRVLKSFLPVADYITSNCKLNNEMIILQDLYDNGFEMKKIKLNENHCRLIFATYGQFHAISLCLKRQNPEEFRTLVYPSTSISNEENNNDEIIEYLQLTIKQTLDMLKKHKQNHLIQKLRPYSKNIKNIFFNAMKYEGDKRCFLHGNCSLKNMMFKYKDNTNQVEAVKLLSFYATEFGSPVHDLSKFFYSEIAETNLYLDKLDSFLNSYYDNFRVVAKRFKQDPNELLPKDELLEHWKMFAKSRMLLALASIIKKSSPEKNTPTQNVINSEQNEVICTLLQHMYDNNFL